MNAISLWQPYAQLMVIREKGNETRSWPTNFRGTVAIHAAKTDPEAVYKLLPAEIVMAIYEALERHGFGPLDTEALPRGAVIGTVDIVGCLKVVHRTLRSATLEDGTIVEGKELVFGDYTQGRYIWRLANQVLFDKPVPARGRQGFWNWEG